MVRDNGEGATNLYVNAEKVNSSRMDRLKKLQVDRIKSDFMILQLLQQLLHVEIRNLFRLEKRLFKLLTALFL